MSCGKESKQLRMSRLAKYSFPLQIMGHQHLHGKRHKPCWKTDCGGTETAWHAADRLPSTQPRAALDFDSNRTHHHKPNAERKVTNLLIGKDLKEICELLVDRYCLDAVGCSAAHVDNVPHALQLGHHSQRGEPQRSTARNGLSTSRDNQAAPAMLTSLAFATEMTSNISRSSRCMAVC